MGCQWDSCGIPDRSHENAARARSQLLPHFHDKVSIRVTETGPGSTTLNPHAGYVYPGVLRDAGTSVHQIRVPDCPGSIAILRCCSLNGHRRVRIEMESFDSQSPHTLSDDELSRLVVIVVDQFGMGLTRKEFNDVVLALFENIAGLETIPVTTARQYLNVLWSKYLQSCNAYPAG